MERTIYSFSSTLSVDFRDSSRTRREEGRGVIFETKRGPLRDQNRALILSDPSADSVSFQDWRWLPQMIELLRGVKRPIQGLSGGGEGFE